ncbi:TrmH family RNA methyltransferase [Asticcacaulis endophyticus]|uniref:RNA methyltransferase n=1 Tax=Asticcacaulis endophyticus TaxID=1395890 RepID=A0A918Q1Z4_9CAUL|nr:RNA methyltransferase [Asticcacaulis endophyticus]GGZ27994.1 RNA methyltransferase [Asticcacaulis endophyticus]
MPVIPLNSANDSRLEPYRHVKDRDLTGRQGLFMAEGKVVLERLFASPLCETVSVLTTPARLEGLSVPDDAPVYIVDQAVMDAVAGFPIHRGYLALGRYAPPQSLEDILAQTGRLRVMALSAIANTDNMGGLMRNAAAFGVDAVVLDSACCDPFYRKAIRVSVGGALVVPHYRLGAGQSLLEVLNTHGLTAYALSPAGDQVLDQIVPAERSAFLLGAEGPGLRREILDTAISVQIPMHGGFDSLNVATTSGIVLYHLCR